MYTKWKGDGSHNRIEGKFLQASIMQRGGHHAKSQRNLCFSLKRSIDPSMYGKPLNSSMRQPVM